MRTHKFLSMFCVVGGVQSLTQRTISQNCTGTFTPVSASVAFAALDPGWNLGNTLDATPDEGSWNNAPVKAATFSQIKGKGFNSIRIPGISHLPDNISDLMKCSNLGISFRRLIANMERQCHLDGQSGDCG